MGNGRKVLRIRLPTDGKTPIRPAVRADLRPWLIALAVHAAAGTWAMTFEAGPAPALQTYEVRIAYLGEEAAPSPVPVPSPEPVAPATPVPPAPAPLPDPPQEIAQSVTQPRPMLAPEPEPVAAPVPVIAVPAPAAVSTEAVSAPTAAGPVAELAGPVQSASGGGLDATPAPAVPARDLAYWRSVREEIVRNLRYPRMPEGARIDTNVVLHITIDPRGRLLDANAGEPNSPFARVALRAVRAASPFDAPAGEVPLAVELPIRFVHAL